jgi:hypothetical protein
MSCDIAKGRLEPCKDSVGGLRAVYFMNFAEAPYSDIVYDVTNTDVVDTVNSTPSTISAYKFELKGNSTFEQNITASRENGTMFVEQVLNLTLKKQDLNTHKEVKLISYGRPKVVVEDYNGNFFFMGIENGADVTAGTIVTGAAMGDLSGYTLTLTAMEKVPANFMNATTEAALATAGLNVVAGV